MPPRLPRLPGKAGPTVVAGGEADHPPAARGAARCLDRDIVGLTAARHEHRVGEVAGSQPGELLSQLGARQAGEVVVPDVQLLSGENESLDDFRVPVPEVERAAV